MTNQDIENMKEFIRDVISEVCWGFNISDGGNIQELAEKYGFIYETKATQDDVSEESDFEVGDTIYKFTDLLSPEEGNKNEIK